MTPGQSSNAGFFPTSELISALQFILPSDRIFLPNSEEIARFHWTTLPIYKKISAVVQPETVEQIQDIVKTASKFSAPLYPISTGNNWGYGCALPVLSGSIVIDLSRMNRILDVNSELAYAVIEPGVTQGQLHGYLQKNGIPLLVDVTGAGPNASILGNAVERGYGLGLYADHFGSMCGMEVVLPNGDLLKTGFGRFESSSAVYSYKWGLGPFVDGLFTQSNFGIVTKIGVWLQPVPEHLEICLAQTNEKGAVFDLVGPIRQLQLEETVRTRINLLSRNRLIALYEQFPWNLANGANRLDEKILTEIGQRYMIGEWNVMFALFGTKRQVSASRKRVKELLSPFCRRVFIASEKRLRIIEKLAKPLGFFSGAPIARLAPSLRLVLNVYSGAPTTTGLRLPYWRNQSIEPPTENINPARDGCGLIWYAPILPIETVALKKFIELADEICRKHDFEFAPTFTAVTARAFDCSLPILFNKADAAESQRALECLQELTREGKNSGFIPYRLGIHGMNDFYDKPDPYWKLIDTIKSAIDPQNIISPGRYGRPPG